MAAADPGAGILPVSLAPTREGEVIIDLPPSFDAGLYFLGRIRTPWRDRQECPRRGDREAGPVCRIEIDARWRQAFTTLQPGADLEILYWMHLARRDLAIQNPKRRGDLFGTFALRSPMRFNPISSSCVVVIGVEADGLLVRGVDCVDGTPVVDIKPTRCPMWPREAAPSDRRDG